MTTERESLTGREAAVWASAYGAEFSRLWGIARTPNDRSTMALHAADIADAAVDELRELEGRS